ncbi:MAG: hypothetical protein AABW83_00465 [Nanoarchaeota archaeon]
MGFFELIKNRGLLEIVDERDNITGYEYEHNIHKKGLRHKSINIIITDKKLTDRNHKLIIAFKYGNFDLPIKTHPKMSQSYLERACDEVEKLFCDKNSEVKLTEIGRYKDDFQSDLENTCLFHFIYNGNLEDTKNTKFIWVKPSDLIKDLIKYNNYSHSLKKAFKITHKNWSKINSPF